MTTDTSYNGWTNRATWLVNLHLSNDHGTYLALRDELARELPTVTLAARARYSEQHWPGLDESTRAQLANDAPRYDLAQLVEAFVASMVIVDDATDDPRSLLANDLVGSTLATVDWREVADGWVSDVEENDGAYNVECVGCDATIDARSCTVDPDGDGWCDECANG